MIKINLFKVCLECEHADIEVNESVLLGVGRHVEIKCAHDEVCGKALEYEKSIMQQAEREKE